MKNEKSFSLGMLFLSLVPFAIISGVICFYGDDFFYSVFFKDGLWEFWNKTVSHYLTMNGRALIHFVDEVVLVAGTPIFAFINPLMLFLLFFFASKTHLEDNNVVYTVIALSVTLMIPQTIARESLWWITGSMNYVLPTVMAVCAFFLQTRAVEKGKQSIGVLLLCFILGAGTELSGAMACAMTFSYAFFNFADKLSKKSDKKTYGFLCFIMVFLGYLTVIFAPGTFNRAAREGSFVAGQTMNTLSALSVMIIGKGGITPYFIAVFILLGLVPFADKSVSKLLKISFAVAVILAVCYLFGVANIPLMLAVVVFTLFVSFLLLKEKNTRAVGAMLVSSAAVIVVLVAAPSTYVRTLLPIILVLTAVISALVTHILGSSKEFYKACAMVLLTIGIICIAPTVKGYISNYKINIENIKSIESVKETGFAEVSCDIDTQYAFTMFYEDGFFKSAFNKYYGIDENTPIYYTVKGMKTAYFNDKRLTHPTLEKEEFYFPLSSLMQTVGYDIYWQDGIFGINTDSDNIIVDKNMIYLSNGEVIDGGERVTYYMGKLYWSESLIEEIFGLSVKTEDEKVNIFAKN
ncbi:MAG: DUF6056 family protein [Clostridia bacterium]|nr:DUF6056 family protein [Clostridia bacterium]